MENLVASQIKCVTLSHAIVQAAKPHSAVSPVLLGVGVSLDHAFGSRWALDMMSRLGFAVSYDEVYRFKQCVVQSDNNEGLPGIYPEYFIQWSADNVDHNINTLDGSGSFHGMGLISMSTAYSKINTGKFSEPSVTRHQRVNVADLVKNGGIPILHYTQPHQSALSKMILKPIKELHIASDLSKALSLDTVWRASLLFSDLKYPRCNWSGYMQQFSVPFDEYGSASDIQMLPLMDLNPNDVSCIYSTLSFVEKQAKLLNMKTACITFDQPLWIKAVDIACSNNMNVVCRLGGFHVIMSYLGSIGKIMAGSGLTEALQTCFGSVTIGHMMSGKAVARSVRGHMLTQSALYALLLTTLKSNQQDDPNSISEYTLDQLRAVCNGIASSEYNLGDRKGIDVQLILSLTKTLEDKLQAMQDDLELSSRTAKLWIQYIKHIQILQDFIRAERTSNWNGHLAALSKMLNIFAAAGHRHYAKSARLYLQMMYDLPQSHPWLHEQLCNNGMHAVRRTDRFWGGLWSDLVIEQVLMASVKSPGGLTHGRGMSDSVRLVWVKSMHRCAAVCDALLHLTQQGNVLADIHHVEFGKSRIRRDTEDLTKIVQFFTINNPFVAFDERLRSLS